jgi:sugar (pentulose or hexulose) kinase
VWNQIKADALGAPVVQAVSGGAPVGAALLAGFGAGLFKDLGKTAETWIEKGARTPPRRKHAAYYSKRSAAYRALLDAMLALQPSDQKD